MPSKLAVELASRATIRNSGLPWRSKEAVFNWRSVEMGTATIGHTADEARLHLARVLDEWNDGKWPPPVPQPVV